MAANDVARLWFHDARAAPLGAGHIHDTFLVTVGSARYVMQRINEHVFQDAEAMLATTAQVLHRWQRQKEYRAPELMRAPGGAAAIRVDGELWRLWRYLEGTRVVDPLRSAAQIEAAGAAFGTFQRVMREFPDVPADPIAGYMQLSHYLAEFDSVRQNAPPDLQRLIAEHQPLASALGDRNTLIHGDCKVNNLLYDVASDTVAAIIDFDTVMQGHWAWDLGDLVRSVCYSRGSCDVDAFAQCVSGFARGSADTRFPGDFRQAAIAPMYVSLMLGVRFLTDHLQGDRYFRVAEPGQNLRRAMEQFDLFQQFLNVEEKLMREAESIFAER